MDNTFISTNIGQYDKEVYLIDAEFSTEQCPVCDGQNIIRQGRCTTCADCGWSLCSV